MKINHIIKPAKTINRFGNARLIRGENGEYALVGGSDGDYTEAKEWVSLFAHDIAFSRAMKRQQPLPSGTEDWRCAQTTENLLQ